MNEKDEQIRRVSMAAKKELLASLGAPRDLQERVLRRSVKANAESKFAREHGFGEIRGIEDYQKHVPIMTYEDYAPWIERMVGGEKNVLSAADPLLFFKSSGSTGGSKYIPVTEPFAKECYMPFFHAGLGDFLEYYPSAIEADESTLNFRLDGTVGASVTPSGLAHLGASQVDWGALVGDASSQEPGWAASWAKTPPEITDHRQRMYFKLRLAAEADLRAIIGINPVLIAALPRIVANASERLIREIRDGTVLGRKVRRANAERARELERLASYFGSLLPCHVWPRLEVIYCWTGGLARLYLDHVRRAFGPQVQLAPAPVAASEGPIGIPVGRHATAGVLALPFVFFEFVDAAQPLGPGTRTKLFDELEVGADYYVILSHVGGLYRYAVGDVVRVVDTYRAVPRVEYLGRNATSSVAGERLRETDVVEAMERVIRSVGVPLVNVSCRAAAGEPSHYELAVELSGRVFGTDLETMARALDERLAIVNPNYGRARTDGRLASASMVAVRPGAFADDWEFRIGQGVRPAQVKDRLFENDDERWSRLTRA